MKKTRYVLPVAVLLAAVALPAAAGSITTTTSWNDGGTGAMFNATIGGTSLSVTSLDLFDTTTSPLTLDVYIKTGSYVGFATTPAAWTLVSATSITGLGSASLTPVNVTPFTLAAGQTYGIYFVLSNVSGSNMLYTTGSATVSNANLTLTLGEGTNGLFGATSVFPGREWDGTINYSLLSSVPEPAPVALLGLAAPGLWLLRRRYLRKY
jgi:hypothetical protein